jgi:poly-gamma-glutamate synthesis protein (capsule biosynthesis protein)
LLVRVTFSQDSAGNWTTSDIAWVASLQGPGPPHRWCPLTTGNTCAEPALDAAVLTRTTDTVNRYDAATDGAHRLDQP